MIITAVDDSFILSTYVRLDGLGLSISVILAIMIANNIGEDGAPGVGHMEMQRWGRSGYRNTAGTSQCW